MKNQASNSYKFSSRLHLVILTIGMLFAASLLAYALFGPAAIYVVLGLSGLGVLLSGNISAKAIIKMQGGRKLKYHEIPVLQQRLQVLAQRAGLDIAPELYLIPSRRMNAFAAGSKQEPVIGITAPLINHLSARELNGVLAHEIAHLRHDDLRIKAFTQVLNRISQIMGSVGKWILLFSIPAVLSGVMPFPFEILALLMVLPIGIQLMDLAISRNREFEADAEAARLTGDALGLASALSKLNRFRWLSLFGMNQSNPVRTLPDWLQTHPNIRKRIARLINA